MTLLVIDKTKGPSPIFTRTPHPKVFKSQYEKDKYWGKEQDYYYNGFSPDINGMLYYYAQNIKLKHRNTGAEYYPTVRDVEVLIFNELEEARKNGEALFIVKGRGVGLSSIGMNLPHYFSRTMPNTNCLATSKNLETLSTIFGEKFVFALKNLHPDIRPDEINLRNTKSQSHFKGGMKYINDDGEEKYSESELICRDTQESDQAASNFSGSGVIYGFGDEAPLMKRFNKFFNSAIECFTDHSINRIVGTLLLGGTVEREISNEDVQRLKKIWDTAKAKRIRTLFLKATYGKHVVNGWSNHTRAEEEILRRREELEEAEKAGLVPEEENSLRSYIKNNPLDITEVFDIASGSYWEEETADKIKQAQVLVKDSDPDYRAYKLLEVNNQITLERHDRSPILIHELPKRGAKYIVGIDGAGSSIQMGSKKGSDFAVVVVKEFESIEAENYKPVAIYAERPVSLEECYRKATNLSILYNEFGECRIFAESNMGTGDNYYTYLKNRRLAHLAMHQPNSTRKKPVANPPIFCHVTIDIRERQIKDANPWLKQYAKYIRFPTLLEDLLKTADDNADLRDAFLMCILGNEGKFMKAAGVPASKLIDEPMPVFNTRTLMWELTSSGASVEDWVDRYMGG